MIALCAAAGMLASMLGACAVQSFEEPESASVSASVFQTETAVPTTQEETTLETATKVPATTASAIQKKASTVKLKNTTKITQDKNYQQTKQQKQEDKNQQDKKPDKPQEDIKPVNPPVVIPTSSVKYPLYATKEYSGFGYFTGTNWVQDDKQYYNDGKKVAFRRGIDISIFQREVGDRDVGIDFKAVKASGVQFVFVRVGARGESSGETWIDRYFVKNVREATAAGLKVGVYFYSQAINETEAIEEAKITLEALKDVADCPIEYPVAIDVENDGSRLGKITKQQRTQNVIAFCEVIRQGGYYPMIYANQSWLDSKLDLSKLPYDIWMACYKDPKAVKTVYGVDVPFTVWQYGGRDVPGFHTGAVDVNVSLVDYAAYLRIKGWNKLSGNSGQEEASATAVAATNE